MISVLIPAYNAENYIAEAINSVLRQTHRAFEIIVVDDGSIDETRRVVESFSSAIRYFHQENCGAGRTRNRCVELASGKFLAFLDADDVWLPDKLELQMREFEREGSLDVVFGMVRQVFQRNWEQRFSEETVAEWELLKGYSQGTMLIKRDSFLKVGTFPEKNTVGEFIDWFLRARETGLKMKLLPDLVMLRRIHQTNVGIRRRAEVKSYVRILKESIDRRRTDKPATVDKRAS